MVPQLSRHRHFITVIKNGFNPQGDSFLAVFDGLFQGITSRETAWKIGDNNAKRLIISTWLDGNLLARFEPYEAKVLLEAR